MLSVNTNYGAMVALQNLNLTQHQLDDVQNQINTGYKVSSAKDNGAVYAIAEGQRARVTSLSAVTDGINRASSTIDVALQAGQSIGDILQQMKAQAVSAEAQDLTTDQRAAIEATYDSLRAQINQVANSAQFNGINLVNGTGTTLNVLMSDIANGTTGRTVTSTPVAGLVPGLSSYIVGQNGLATADNPTFNLNGVAIGTVTLTATTTIQQYLDAVNTQTGGRVTANYDQATGTFTYNSAEATSSNDLSITTGGSANSWIGEGVTATAAAGAPVTLAIAGLDFTSGGTGALSTISTANNIMGTANSAQQASTDIDTAISTLNEQLATLGSQSKALGVQKDFISSLSDSVTNGIGNLVDADLAKASATLQSLQIKQQLGAQALSIANQAPQIILSLFKGA